MNVKNKIKNYLTISISDRADNMDYRKPREAKFLKFDSSLIFFYTQFVGS